LYNVDEQRVISKFDSLGLGGAPCSFAWGFSDQNGIMFIGGRGPLIIWSYKEDCRHQPAISNHPEIRGFSSNVCLMRCHPSHPDRIALGHVDGSISLFIPGKLYLSMFFFCFLLCSSVLLYQSLTFGFEQISTLLFIMFSM
jgi:hypothetical protein